MAIKISVSAVLAVVDGFTGRPPAPSALRCTLDGKPYKPIVKDGGYYVFISLEPGEHRVTLSGSYYRDETVILSPGGAMETVVTMKPAQNYPFGGAVTRLELQTAYPKLWMAQKSETFEIKIAQDEAEVGATEARVFFRETVKSLSIPRDFLLEDGEYTEICRISELNDGEGLFYAPLRHPHKRGRAMYPAQLYTADENGLIRGVFRRPQEVMIYLPDSGRVEHAELKAGENRLEIK